MPKHNQLFAPGDKVPKDLLNLLQKYFDEKQLIKLEKFGGRVQISLTAPFVDRKKQNKDLIIDENFIQSMYKDLSQTKIKLKSMTAKQLKFLAEKLNFKISTQASVTEIRKAIFDYFESGEMWKGISRTGE